MELLVCDQCCLHMNWPCHSRALRLVSCLLQVFQLFSSASELKVSPLCAIDLPECPFNLIIR